MSEDLKSGEWKEKGMRVKERCVKVLRRQHEYERNGWHEGHFRQSARFKGVRIIDKAVANVQWE